MEVSYKSLVRCKAGLRYLVETRAYGIMIEHLWAMGNSQERITLTLAGYSERDLACHTESGRSKNVHVVLFWGGLEG